MKPTKARLKKAVTDDETLYAMYPELRRPTGLEYFDLISRVYYNPKVIERFKKAISLYYGCKNERKQPRKTKSRSS